MIEFRDVSKHYLTHQSRKVIVDHLNLGAALIGERAERLRVATLGCQAERRARAAAAYGPALE